MPSHFLAFYSGGFLYALSIFAAPSLAVIPISTAPSSLTGNTTQPIYSKFANIDSLVTFETVVVPRSLTKPVFGTFWTEPSSLDTKTSSQAASHVSERTSSPAFIHISSQIAQPSSSDFLKLTSSRTGISSFTTETFTPALSVVVVTVYDPPAPSFDPGTYVVVTKTAIQSQLTEVVPTEEVMTVPVTTIDVHKTKAPQTTAPPSGSPSGKCWNWDEGMNAMLLFEVYNIADWKWGRVNPSETLEGFHTALSNDLKKHLTDFWYGVDAVTGAPFAIIRTHKLPGEGKIERAIVRAGGPEIKCHRQRKCRNPLAEMFTHQWMTPFKVINQNPGNKNLGLVCLGENGLGRGCKGVALEDPSDSCYLPPSQ